MDDFETAKQFFIEGLHLLEANNFQAAERQFTRSLEIVPDRVSILNNLSVTKIRLEKFAEAEKLALKAIAAGDASLEAWSNLGVSLTATDRHEEALQAYDRALNSNPACARAWLNKAMTLLELKRYDEALPACEQALKLSPGQYEGLYTKSQVLKEIGRTDEARKVYLTSLGARAALSPVFVSERRATQKGDILIVSANPIIDDSFKSFEMLQRHCTNFPRQIAANFSEDFHFSFLFETDAIKPTARKQIPQPGLIINNCANGELLLSGGNLWRLTTLMDGFGVPVVNHPTKVIQTTRDGTARLLSDLSGVLVPKTLRFSSAGKTPDELVREIEEQYNYPLILRTLASQEGKGMKKFDRREELLAAFSAEPPGKFFVTQFVDRRKGNEFYRKIRAAVVKDEIILTRVDYNTFWNIHGRKSEKRVPFYLENKHLLEEEKKICKNPEAELGRAAVESLRALRNRIPLDAFGIDFDVDGDGLVVFYEANASMNLFSTAQKEVPNPQESEDRLKQAFQNYLTSLVTGRG